MRSVKLALDKIDQLADGGDLFAAAHLLAFFDQQTVVVGIGGDPAVVMAHQNQVAEAFQLVAGIGDGAGVRGFDGGAAGGFDVDAVVGAAFADGAEFGYDGPPYRPREFALAVFGDRV